ncbi:hypothetical protein Syun_023417 [Stephania yunnanensis]|uniref:Uncharacterized protein n=1 Tax=Stephania yunnanensis TaxID=152371 RepID=A0AAP0F8Z1_9MAGN
MEAAWNGVRVLAWPQGGDQKVNAAVVEGCGLGVWKRDWEWGVVGGEDIGRKIREMMEDEELKASAGMVREEAKRAVGDDGGSSRRSLEILVEIWSNGCGSASSKFASTGA